MNRASLILSLVAIVCCVGMPLLLGAGGLSLIAALKGGVLVGALMFVILAGAIAIYAYVKHRNIHS